MTPALLRFKREYELITLVSGCSESNYYSHSSVWWRGISDTTLLLCVLLITQCYSYLKIIWEDSVVN